MTIVTPLSASFHILRFGCRVIFAGFRGNDMPAGKTAIVTGSTSGIGLGIATMLAGSGTDIVLNGFGPPDEIVMKDVLLAARPTKELVEVSQIAALATFLCFDEAASITGALLPIDDGWTAH